MNTTIASLAKADWELLERDVVERIRLLAKLSRSLNAKQNGTAMNDAIANDLILPNVQLLAAFCEAVKIDDE